MVTLDFETFYSKQYSLSKMTTEAYIRSPKFQVIGVSIKKDFEPTVWHPGTEDLSKVLHDMHLENEAVICHNAVFDCAILSWVYGIRPKAIIDTLSLARPVVGILGSVSLRSLAEYYHIGQKGTEIYNTLGKRLEDFTPEELDDFGAYCVQDVELTWKLWKKLAHHTSSHELILIDTLIRMFTEPVFELDKTILEKHLEDVLTRKQELLDSIGHDNRDALMSNQKFAELLREAGVEPPTKISPTTGKETFAFSKTDEAFRDLLEYPDDRVQALVAARLGLKSTIEETRTQTMLDIANRGKLPIFLNYYGAVNTGRTCLTGDTDIVVLRDGVAEHIRLDHLKDSDLVWDGESFVEHGGLACRGKAEVITYQGVTGTPDHRVYAEESNGEISLLEASLGGYTLETAGAPKQTGAKTKVA